MDDKKYQIFISSTYTDLKSARNKVMETILSAYHLPVGMEMFSAGDAEQWEIIQETIQSSDYYILIAGHRYGSVTDDGISYTEKEYDFAKETGLPILAFIRSRDIATKPEERESDPSKDLKLDSFIKKAKSNKMCDFWETEDELATKVVIALQKIFKRTPRIGWIRGDQAMSPQVLDELARLSSENSKLRNEVAELKSQLSERSPEIDVVINDHNDFFEFILDRKSKDYIKLNGKLTIEDFSDDLKLYIADGEISRYNQSLPSSDELKKLEESINFHFMLHKEINKIYFNVINRGNSKANELFITIDFPEEIKIIKNDEIKDIKLPKNNLPENLISVAKKRKEAASFAKMSNIEKVVNMNLRQAMQVAQPISSFLPRVNRNILSWTKLTNNSITIKLTSLLHTRAQLFDDEYSFLPIAQGNYKIKISIICEEMESSFTKEIPAIVKIID